MQANKVYRLGCGLKWVRQVNRAAAIAALLLAGALDLAAAELTLVRDGQPAAVIVTAADPFPSQKLAAEELQYHIEKMSGAKLPILTESQAVERAATVILVGQSRRLAELGIDTANLPAETLIVKTIGNALVLAGEDGDPAANARPDSMFSLVTVRTGTMSAVYDFLQDQLGCRWIWPGETGEVIPRRRTVAIGELDIRETPLLVQRHFRPVLGDAMRKVTYKMSPYLDMQAVYDQVSRDESLWLRRMRMGRAAYIKYGHAFTTWWEKYGADHPDIFAQLPDGKRGPIGSAEGVKMCVSNPKLWDMQIEEFKKLRALKGSGYEKALNACENDGNSGWCTCAGCRAWDPPMDQATLDRLKKEGWDVEAYTNSFALAEDGLPKKLGYRYARWYNELARRVREIDPSAYVMAYSYNRYGGVPHGLKLEPNILIGLTGFSTYPLPEERLLSQRESLAGWDRCGGHYFFRPNSFHFTGHAVPFNVSRQMAEDLQFLLKSGVRMTDFDSLTGFWATTGPMYYLLARLHWDTAADIKALEDEYYQAFGPMAKSVREYCDYWEKWTMETWLQPGLEERIKALSPHGNRRGRIMVLPELYTAKAFADGRAILDRAKPRAAKAAEDERRRFENIEMGLRHAELMTQGTRLTHAFRTAPNTGSMGDIRELARATSDLVDYRRRIADRNVVNVYWCTRVENLFGFVQNLQLARDLGNREGLGVMRANRWKVRFDPEGVGESATNHWGAGKAADGWSSEGMDRTWEGWKLNRAWKEQHGKDYTGAVWARIDFQAPAPDEGKRLGLLFAGVKGNLRVWINGKLVGSKSYVPYQPKPRDANVKESDKSRENREKQEEWERKNYFNGPFDFDITEFVTAGKAANTLAVKLSDDAEPGGVIRSVYIFQADKIQPAAETTAH